MEIQKKTKEYKPYNPNFEVPPVNRIKVNEEQPVSHSNSEQQTEYYYARSWEEMERAERAFKSMVIGFGICLIGVILTVVTYFSASEGGTYYLMWGAILFGGIRGLIGLIQILKYKGNF